MNARKLWESIEDGRGYIYWYEFTRRFPIGLDPRDARYADLAVDQLDVMDADGNKRIDFREFHRYLRDKHSHISSKDAERLFNAMDRAGRGYIRIRDFEAEVSPHEDVVHHLEDVLDRIRKRKVDHFKAMDTNRSTMVSFQEFYDYLNKKRVGLNRETARFVYNKIDANGDGVLTIHEFEEACPDDGKFVDWVYDLAEDKRRTWE